MVKLLILINFFFCHNVFEQLQGWRRSNPLLWSNGLTTASPDAENKTYLLKFDATKKLTAKSFTKGEEMLINSSSPSAIF